MSLEQCAGDGLRQDVGAAPRGLHELHRHAFALPDLLADQLVFRVPVLGSLTFTVLSGEPDCGKEDAPVVERKFGVLSW